MSIRVGGPAPEFAAPAYYQGRFTDIRLSDAAGKWARTADLAVLFVP